MRCPLYPLHRVTSIRHVLCERHVEHGSRRLAQSKTSKLGVPHDADDFKGAGVFGFVQAEMLTERILVTLEEATHERLVHDGHRGRRFVVGFGEFTTPQELHAEVLKIARAHPIPRRAGLRPESRWRMASYHDQLAPVVSQRVVKGQS